MSLILYNDNVKVSGRQSSYQLSVTLISSHQLSDCDYQQITHQHGINIITKLFLDKTSVAIISKFQ